MRFLIAGLGSIGRRHLRNLISLGEKDILLFRTHQSTLPDAELAGLPEFTDLQTALSQKVDGVIVANPTSAHITTALPASAAGANLLIEKPVSDSLEGLDQLKSNLEKAHKQALVGFHFRYHPVLKQIKVMLEEGQLGKPLCAQAHWGEYLPGWHPWEDYRQSYAARADLGGGVLNTLSHPLDYLRWMFGEVQAVSGQLSNQSSLGLDVEDNADCLLSFENQLIASAHLDYYQRPPSHTLSITCSEGRILWDNDTGSAQVFKNSVQSWSWIKPPDQFERNDMFLEEMADFIRLCRGETIPHCGLSDGLRVQEIVKGIKESSADQSRLVWLT